MPDYIGRETGGKLLLETGGGILLEIQRDPDTTLNVEFEDRILKAAEENRILEVPFEDRTQEAA